MNTNTSTMDRPARRARRSPAQPNAPGVQNGKGIKVTISTTINALAEELFGFWRNFENLPRVMHHVESVQVISSTHSKWRVRYSDDKHIEWEAEIINEHPNEMIAWRSVEGSEVRHAGTVWFTPAPGGLGTEVKFAVEYEAGKLADGLAKLLRFSPEQQMREDLRHFKQWIEAREIPTTAGQPSGRRSNVENKYVEAK